MKQEDIDGIRESGLFVHLLQPSGFESSEGQEHLRYAMGLGKHIIVWRLPDRRHLSLPRRPFKVRGCSHSRRRRFGGGQSNEGVF